MMCRMLILSLVSMLLAAGATGPAQAEPAPRIVSLAPHLTELAFSAGAGDRIVATVDYSDHPAAARSIPRVGDAFRVDFERVLAMRPDLVLVWAVGTPEPTIERLRSLRLNVVVFHTNRIDDVASSVREIGRLAGTGAVAEAAATRFERRIQALRMQYQERPVVSVFLQIDDRPLYTVNGKQIMSTIVELCGGRNVFAQLNELAPAVGIEAVIAANPQVIITTDHLALDAKLSWSQWRHIDAVRHDNVYTLPANDLSRATIRLIVGVEAVCRTLDTARQHLGMAAAPHAGVMPEAIDR